MKKLLLVAAAVLLWGFVYAQKVNEAVGAKASEGASYGARIPAKADGTLEFAVMSDVHISVGAPSVEGTRACVEDINNNPDIQFVIISGDIANFGRDDELAVAKEIFDSLNKPWFIIAGNHDATWSESGTNSFLRTFGYERFEFEAGGLKFLGTQCGPNIRMAPALVPRESMIWLNEQIEQMPDNQPLVFVNHYPLDTSLLKYDEVIGMLKKKNIQLVLSGHWHVNRAMDYEGIPGAIIRSALKDAQREPGYVIVKVEGATVTFREKIAGAKSARHPWYVVRLSNGAPYDAEVVYAHPKNSYNQEYPFVKTVWRYENNADIGCGPALYALRGASGNKPAKGMQFEGKGFANNVPEGDIVIFADEAGVVRALDYSGGSLLWEYRTEGKIFSTPAIDGDRVIVGSSDNYIYCLNVRTGALVWRYRCDKSVLGSPNIQKGVVYIGASDGKFRALNARSGKLIWEYGQLKGFIVSRPYVDEQQVVIGDWGNTLYSFNPRNGSLQWMWNTPRQVTNLSPAQVWPVKSKGKIFIVCPDRISYAIDASSGRQLNAVYGGREAIGISPDGNQYYIKSMKDTVRAYSTDDYSVAWQTVTGYGYEIAPTAITTTSIGGKEGKGILFIATDKGNIFALNCADGSILFKHNVSGSLVNYIMPVGRNKLLITTMDGVVTLLEYKFDS